MSWYVVKLTSKQVENNQQSVIQDMFMQAFMSLAGPRDLAMFSQRAEDSASLNLYFTPELGKHPALIATLSAEPSEQPPVTAALLVGHQDALTRFRTGSL